MHHEQRNQRHTKTNVFVSRKLNVLIPEEMLTVFLNWSYFGGLIFSLFGATGPVRLDLAFLGLLGSPEMVYWYGTL